MYKINPLTKTNKQFDRLPFVQTEDFSVSVIPAHVKVM